MPETNPEVALEDRLVSSAIAALEMYSIHLGRQLGLYEALTSGPCTAAELSVSTDLDLRHTREWLEQQAVAGFIGVEGAERPWQERRYTLDGPSAAVFIQAEDPRHVSPLADMVVGVGQAMDAVSASFRSGKGVPFSDYGPHLREGQGAVNRPAFAHDLVPSWIGAVDGLTERLNSGGRIADLGCGVGWSTIAMAAQLPAADVSGWDNDRASIERARHNASGTDVAVGFHEADAAAMAADGPFDLVTILEALHDMAQPAAVLRAACAALKADGVVLIADEKVADQFIAPGDEIERFMFGWSVTHCLPASLTDQPSAAIGTAIRASVVRELAADAGFTSVDELDVDAGFFRLYVLRNG
jgi:SAM-dependent methyltransferase